MERRRVAVTGIGLVSPLGVGAGPTWSALLESKSGIGLNTRFDTADYPSKIAGEINSRSPKYMVSLLSGRDPNRRGWGFPQCYSTVTPLS